MLGGILSSHFRDSIFETGCRPSESIKLAAKHNESDGDTMVARLWGKTCNATRKNRLIYMSDGAYEIVARLSKGYPRGPLFTHLPSDKSERLIRTTRFSGDFRKMVAGLLVGLPGSMVVPYPHHWSFR
jgi:hypothetical protein